LEKCITSIIEQNIEGMQIILVNDGSTDNSGSIAQKFEEKYPNQVMYLEKQNGGLSDARNYGLKHATGDYISFVDSDDYLEKDLYKNLQSYMEQDYDIVKFKIQKVDEQGNVLEKNYSPTFEQQTGEEAFDILYKTDVMLDVAWSYIYKRELFVKNNFEYAKGLYHEDFGLTSLVILKASKVASVDVLGYNYVQTTSSITRGNEQTTYNRAQDLLVHYDNMIEKIKEYNISDKSKENIKIYYTNCILLEITNIKSKKQQNEYIKEIKKRKMVNNIKARNIKQLIKKILLRINIKLYLKLR
jgi:glycosyltransferase involved in cell wall biosynthesis